MRERQWRCHWKIRGQEEDRETYITKSVIPEPLSGMTPMSGRKPARSDRFLQLLGGAEGDLLRSLDLDGLAGGGVAAHARGALADLEDAEANDADALALLQVLRDQTHSVVQDGLGLFLRDLLVLCDRRRKVLQGDGRRGRFLRHIGPPRSYRCLRNRRLARAYLIRGGADYAFRP